MKHKVFVFILFSALTSICGGCSLVVLTTKLPDGQLSVMNDNSNRMRTSFDISPMPLRGKLEYHQIHECNFVQTLYIMTDKPETTNVKWSIKNAANKKLIVVMTESNYRSTALIDSSGKLFDYNYNSKYGQYTPESHIEMNNNMKESVKKKYGSKPGMHTLNDISFMIPHYIAQTAETNTTIGSIDDESGNVWARYVYRGMTDWHGTRVAVLDIVRFLEDSPEIGDVVVGFALVDPQNSLLVYVNINSGSIFQLERVSCTN